MKNPRTNTPKIIRAEGGVTIRRRDGSVESVKPITVIPKTDEKEANAPQVTTGSGFIVHSDGYILTCAHVVSGASQPIAVLLEQDKQQCYEVIRCTLHPTQDLALLKINNDPWLTLTPVTFGNPHEVSRQSEVSVIGYPLVTQLGAELSTSSGHINAIRAIAGNRCFELDAKVNPGNSGGPLINDRGEVIGVVSARIDAERTNLAIPIHLAYHPLLSSIPGLSTGSSGRTERLEPEQRDALLAPSMALIVVF
jgi:S1-C subfamily serine protease